MFGNYFAHLNLRVDLGRYVTWVNNPQYHRLHHSIRAEHLDHNFTQLLPLWDHLFGTLWVPAKHEWPATGLDDGAQPRSLLSAVSWPLGSRAGSDATPGREPLAMLDKKRNKTRSLEAQYRPDRRCRTTRMGSRGQRGGVTPRPRLLREARTPYRPAAQQADDRRRHDKHTQRNAQTEQARTKTDQWRPDQEAGIAGGGRRRCLRRRRDGRAAGRAENHPERYSRGRCRPSRSQRTR